jgi:hypothetical protein
VRNMADQAEAVRTGKVLRWFCLTVSARKLLAHAAGHR